MSSVKWTRLFGEAGYESAIFCIRGSKLADLAKRQGLKTFEIDKPSNYFSFGARSEFKKIMQTMGPNVVFSHRTKDLWHLSPILKGYPGVSLISFARMFIRGVNKNDWLHRKIYSRVDKMIALSQIQKSLLLSCLPLQDSKYTVVPNGVDIERFYPRKGSDETKESLGWTGPGLLVGLIGRIDIQKGHREFVEAAAMIHEKHPKVRFVMVGGENSGEKNDSYKTIKSMISEHQLENVITVTGHRKDIPEILNSLDIFCMPSYEENFGNVMLEAMASGSACVGTNSGGTPEMIQEGHSGILVSPKSSEALTGGLLRLIEDDELRKHVADNARRVACEKFDMKEVFRSVERLIQDLQTTSEETSL